MSETGFSGAADRAIGKFSNQHDERTGEYPVLHELPVCSFVGGQNASLGSESRLSSVKRFRFKGPYDLHE
jgi:hypothetical protein